MCLCPPVQELLEHADELERRSGTMSSRARRAPYAAAARIPSGVSVEYSATTSAGFMPAAKQSRITLTGTRVPATTACPCITWGSVEISSS